MIKNKFRPLPLFIYFISVVSVLFLSIRTYGLSSSLLGRLESSKIEEINYDRQMPAFNGFCLYSYHDGQEILEKYLTGDNYQITIRKSYTDNSDCYGKIMGSNLPQGILYEDIEENVWIDLQVGMKQGVPTWSQEPIFIFFLLLINTSFFLAYRSEKTILIGLIFFIFYSLSTFDKHNRYSNGIDSVVPNQMHIQKIIDQLNK
tara:strand:+ start:1141 stop:1749 length:609 start_codon:yes stop_codon:yes gene_type:complete